MQLQTSSKKLAAALAMASTIVAQDTASPSSSPAMSSSPSTNSAITTSIGINNPIRDLQTLGIDIPDMPQPTALSGSIITVNPSGTVVDIACPYASTDAAACDILYNSATFTIRPSIEYNHIDLETAINGHSGRYIANAVCTVSDTVEACVADATLYQGETSRKATITTQSTVSQVPLTLTGGLEKAGPIPPATETTGASAPSIRPTQTDSAQPSSGNGGNGGGTGAASSVFDFTAVLLLGAAAVTGIFAAVL